jgi:hypothetical protein
MKHPTKQIRQHLQIAIFWPVFALLIFVTSCDLGDRGGPLTVGAGVVMSPFIPLSPAGKLYKAINAGKTNKVDLLLTAHPELINERYSETPLQIAQRRGDSNMVDVIRRHGAKE